MAETFVAMPFLIVTVEGALRSADRGFGRDPRGDPMTVFRRITMPLIAPSLGACGSVLEPAPSASRGDDHLAGSFGAHRTMPIAVYYARERPDARSSPRAVAGLRHRACHPERQVAARRIDQ
jgi:molybdate transport system permease protein